MAISHEVLGKFEETLGAVKKAIIEAGLLSEPLGTTVNFSYAPDQQGILVGIHVKLIYAEVSNTESLNEAVCLLGSAVALALPVVFEELELKFCRSIRRKSGARVEFLLGEFPIKGEKKEKRKSFALVEA